MQVLLREVCEPDLVMLWRALYVHMGKEMCWTVHEIVKMVVTRGQAEPAGLEQVKFFKILAAAS